MLFVANCEFAGIVEVDLVALTDVHRERMQQEREDRERMREEMRQDLKAISDKLDRLIESRLLGNAEDGA